MVVAIVVSLLVFWIGVGVVLALLLGRATRIADDHRHDLMVEQALRDLGPAPVRRAERQPARV